MLEIMGVPRAGALLVHSAFKTFSREGYDADEVLAALAEYMEPGTLLLPAMSWRFVKPDSPVFDAATTPSNTGVLAETFRTRYATARSLHPTHSVAGRGREAERILGTHHLCVTPCDRPSPFGQLVEADGYVIMLGVGIDCCTLLHHVEEIAAPDVYCRPATEIETYSCRRLDGSAETVRLRRHLKLPRDFWQFQDMLAAAGKLGLFRCDNSTCIGFRARDLVATALPLLERDPRAIIARPGQRYRIM